MGNMMSWNWQRWVWVTNTDLHSRQNVDPFAIYAANDLQPVDPLPVPPHMKDKMQAICRLLYRKRQIESFLPIGFAENLRFWLLRLRSDGPLLFTLSLSPCMLSYYFYFKLATLHTFAKTLFLTACTQRRKCSQHKIKIK